MKSALILSDNLEYIKSLPDNSIDTIITDSPYGLGKKQNLIKILQAWLDHGYLEISGTGFMGKKWDAFVPQPILWKECYRVLKPGGHLASFFGTRTYQLGALAIELAGFEIRDMICWHYGSGFPKSLDISKAFDKEAGAEREVIGSKGTQPNHKGGKYASVGENGSHEREAAVITAPSTQLAIQWQGWGNALKPATEPIVLARKPLEGTTIQNVEKYGTGGINIDACRIEFKSEKDKKSAIFGRGTDITGGNFVGSVTGNGQTNIEPNCQGRFPANVILDDFMANELDLQTGVLTSGAGILNRRADNKVFCSGNQTQFPAYGDSGGASRFFYCAKANTSERAGATHPTIKPLKLMVYLVKLLCPPGGIVLDPHSGSGTTAEACLETGMRYIAIDNDPKSHEEGEARIARWYTKFMADIL